MNCKLPYCEQYQLPCAGSARAHVGKAPHGGTCSSLFLRRQHSFVAAQKLLFYDTERNQMKWPLSGRTFPQRLHARTSPWEHSCNIHLSRGGSGGSCSTGHSSIHSLCEASIYRHIKREHRRCHRTLLWQPLDRRKCPRLTCLSDAASSAASSSNQHELEEADPAGSRQWDPTQVLHGLFTSVMACMHAFTAAYG